MCGICGFTGHGSPEDLERMVSALVHRGPDDEGRWYDLQRGVFLGHRRLFVIDIEGGAQPMWTADGRTCVVYNGEIYNHLALRRELEDSGHIFKTDHSDTEVLLHGYKQWGVDLPNHLNGMWAFAVYDRTGKSLFLSRDRFGEKPLFYTHQNDLFAFSSELTSLVRHSHIQEAISKKSLKKYFAYGFIPAPRSLYKGIYKLSAGYNLLFDLRNFTQKIWKYWEFVIEPFDTIPKDPVQEWGGKLRELLRRAVQRRLMSDVPLGFLLSGGIDSSAITAFAAEELQNRELKTFSIGFTEKSFDESRFAAAVAGRHRTDHHLRVFSIDQARDTLPHIVAHLDEPLGDSSLVPTFMLCRETRKKVTVALGGDGGDELFAGYDPFKALKAATIYNALFPRLLHPAIRTLLGFVPVSHRYMSFDFKLKRALNGLSYPDCVWNAVWLGSLEPAQIDELFREPTDIEDIYVEAIEQWENCAQDHLVDKTLQFYTRLYLQDNILVKTDRASMMNSLEVRAPFLDIELVDFVRKLPHFWKYRGGQTKYILKKALEPVVTRKIAFRTKKGFGAPVGRWFQEGHLRWEQHSAMPAMAGNYIEKLFRQHRSGRNDHRLFLWNIWLLGEFLKRNRKGFHQF